MKLSLFLIAACIVAPAISAQTVCTSPAAEQVMLGKYNPQLYKATTVITDPAIIAAGINAGVSPDSLHAYLVQLATFETRNSGSDTVSQVRGIGAARRWIHHKFQQFSSQNDNRLQPFYLRFDYNICGIMRHDDVCAVLPGSDTSLKDFILIEAHFDTRCAGLCDTACLAEGMEDNGSGTALVMELARVLSKYSFKRSIVFMATTAEEQGLLGARAFASYAKQKGMKIRAVMNNDVVGGVICGNTSSPPSCPGAGLIDSTNLRLFSRAVVNSPHKQLARFIKLQYKEMIHPIAAVPMNLHIMTPEDRTGRGGDHIPFGDQYYTSMRFTSANEHGDANVAAPGYNDRQHTSADVLGVDTDADLQIDSFFVDFNYLARNTVINGNAAAMAAMGPVTPAFQAVHTGNSIYVSITMTVANSGYRLALRSLTNDWDTVFNAVQGPAFTVVSAQPPNSSVRASLASVDSLGTESLFSFETVIIPVGMNDQPETVAGVELLQNVPNPYDEATAILVKVNSPLETKMGKIRVTDLTGRLVAEIPVRLEPGINEAEFFHGYHATGTYLYALEVDGHEIARRKMVLTGK